MNGMRLTEWVKILKGLLAVSFDGLQEGEKENCFSLCLVTEWTWTRKKISNPVLVIGEENYWWMVVVSSQLPEYRKELTSGYLDNQQRTTGPLE